MTSLAWAHPVVREWFVAKFGTPTSPQEQGWPLIDCVKLGNKIGAVKIAYRGGQNHPVDKTALGL